MSTGKLNKVFKEIIEKRGPSSRLGTQAKIYFATQVASMPPTIVLAVNKPDLFTDHYQRYLLNRIREMTPFEEVPVRLIFRERRRADLKEMMQKGRSKAYHAGQAKGIETEEGGFIEFIEDDDDFSLTEGGDEPRE